MNDQKQKASERILNALNEVDEAMIEEAAPRRTNTAARMDEAVKQENYAFVQEKKKVKTKKSGTVVYLRSNWKKLTAIAACLVVFIAGGSGAWQRMNMKHSDIGYSGSYSYTADQVGSSWENPRESLNFEEMEEEWVNKGFSNSLVQSDDTSVNQIGPEGGVPKPGVEQKLIYTANLKLETLEFDAAVREIKEKITELGGFIESDEIYDSSNGYWYNDNYEKKKGTMTENITVRIPAEKYNEFLNAASGVNGKVTSLVQNVENITREYSDLSTTIQSLQTQESRLLEMLKEAETIEDMIYVEARLSEVQNELRIYQNRLNIMDTDVAYSTVYLKIAEVVKYTNTPTPKSTFLERLQNTLASSGDGFLNFLENTLFFVITVLPEVLLAAIVILLVVWLVKSRKNKKNTSKSGKSDVQDE